MQSIKNTLKDIQFVVMAVIRNPFSKTAPQSTSATAKNK